MENCSIYSVNSAICGLSTFNLVNKAVYFLCILYYPGCVLYYVCMCDPNMHNGALLPVQISRAVYIENSFVTGFYLDRGISVSLP